MTVYALHFVYKTSGQLTHDGRIIRELSESSRILDLDICDMPFFFCFWQEL